MACGYYGWFSATTAVFSVLAAILSGWCAFLSYKLAAKLRDEMKSDERIIVSRIIHPGLPTPEHDNCVITCTLFNKSKRKAYVNRVSAYDRQDESMEVTWSNRINEYGNPETPCGLIGIVDEGTLFLRRNDGKEIEYCRMEIFHSFSRTSITVAFNKYAEDFG